MYGEYLVSFFISVGSPIIPGRLKQSQFHVSVVSQAAAGSQSAVSYNPGLSTKTNGVLSIHRQT
jgi:hypothetical protein